MATTLNEKEIIDLEHTFWRAIQRRDIEGAAALIDDVSIVTGAQGYASIQRKEFSFMMKSDKWELLQYEFLGEPAVRFLGPDAAIIAYKVREDLAVEGKPLTLEAFDASTWVRRNGKWQCALHTETLLGDPFGRDRVVKAATDKVIAEQDAVANLAVKDLGKARRFYEGTMGLTPVRQEGDEVIIYRSGNSTVNVYRSQYAGTNQSTAVTWAVHNIEDAVKGLKSKGVIFEHYDMPDTKLEGDIHVSEGMKVAWFKDPDGNILNIISQ